MDVWSANVRHVTLEQRRRRAQRPHLSLLSRARLLPHPSAGVPRLTLRRSLHRVRIPLHPSAIGDRVWRRRVRLEAVPDGGRSDDAGAPPPPPQLATPSIRPSHQRSRASRTANLGRPAHPSSPPFRPRLTTQAEWLGGLVSELEANSVGCAAPCGSPDYPLPSGGIASGGVVFAWRDEWYKGSGSSGNSIGPHNGTARTGTRRGTRSARRPPAARPPRPPARRPPASQPATPTLSGVRLCPAFLGGGDKTNDGFMNEEWYATWDAPRTRECGDSQHLLSPRTPPPTATGTG